MRQLFARSNASTRGQTESVDPDAARVADALRDPKAFAELFDAYWDAIFKYCYYHCGDWHQAEDLASEVFVKALANLKNFDPSVAGTTFRAWLYGIARNVVVTSYQLDGGVNFGPSLAGGVLYVSTDAGTLYALGQGGSSSVTPIASALVASGGFDSSQVELVWESGTSAHPLSVPEGSAIAPDGNIYVVNAVHDSIDIYSPDGQWVDSLGGSGSGPGQFSFHKPSESAGLGDLGFDADGNLYVFDTLNNRIQKFAPDHTFLLEWGTYGTGNGQFNEVTGGVDPVAGRVYATDLNNRVQVFDLDGTFLDKWGSPGAGPSKFRKPTDVAVDSHGNVYVAEEEGHRIQKFDQFGAFLDGTGSIGTMPGTFTMIFGMAFDANDYLFVTDSQAGTVQIFGPDGSFVGRVENVAGVGKIPFVSGVAVSSDGFLYVSDEERNRLLKLKLPPLE